MSTPKAKSLDRMMDDASVALTETRYFDAERTCIEALNIAMDVQDYERVGRICMPLLEARRQIRMLAIDSGNLVCLRSVDDIPAEPVVGCYVFEPMLVAADARNYRELAHSEGVPVFVLAREPETDLGDWPVAMIGPVTVRTKVEPPVDGVVSLAWMQSAHESLGEAAIAKLDQDQSAADGVADAFDLLGTVPEHERMHQVLSELARDAARVSTAEG